MAFLAALVANERLLRLGLAPVRLRLLLRAVARDMADLAALEADWKWTLVCCLVEKTGDDGGFGGGLLCWAVAGKVAGSFAGVADWTCTLLWLLIWDSVGGGGLSSNLCCAVAYNMAFPTALVADERRVGFADILLIVLGCKSWNVSCYAVRISLNIIE